MTERKIPVYTELLWPTLKALEDKGGSASIQELSEQMASNLQMPNETLGILHKDGPQSEFDYRAAWARTYLKQIGAIENPSRAIWAITETGRRLKTEEDTKQLCRTRRAMQRKRKQAPRAEPKPENDVVDDERDWQKALLDILRSVPPDAFERLCQRVLRESGIAQVQVTSRSGDGGIAGTGVLQAGNLISFRLRFQCKRHSGTVVGAREIRDFRAATKGRADKGLFITAGKFTKDAEWEAAKDDAPAIDLIDGADLCNILKELGLGVSTETVEVVKPKPQFFAGL